MVNNNSTIDFAACTFSMIVHTYYASKSLFVLFTALEIVEAFPCRCDVTDLPGCRQVETEVHVLCLE